MLCFVFGRGRVADGLVEGFFHDDDEGGKVMISRLQNMRNIKRRGIFALTSAELPFLDSCD